MNDDVDAINSLLINRFPGTPATYKGYDSMLDDNCNIYPAEFISKLCPGGIISIGKRTMGLDSVFLNDLTISSTNYKVKVKVIDKGRARVSNATGVLFQGLLLQDDQGNKMKGTLFGDQVEGFKDALVYNGMYEISNAPISAYAEKWRNNPSDLNYQMGFGRQTVVTPLDTETGPPEPAYQCFAQLPRVADRNAKFDVLGVVLFVEGGARKVIVGQDREYTVREIVLADHSNPQPLTIFAWNDLAEDECTLLRTGPRQFKIVGITALKVSPHKGFSMATTMSTTFIHSPTGEKARALAEWAASHQSLLTNMQSRILTVRVVGGQKTHLQLSALKAKRASTTLQDERYWIKATIPGADLHRVHAYIGCSRCGRGCDVS
ncbi:replication protein A 70 kDa DNA-binding subunit B-like [Silene latifolia]|uniref:replication protein A 70 kDa DNA-binding subunit B-like n=1 Tax=Silene latifolia TaxID=37657 RepID=UPI003D773BC7